MASHVYTSAGSYTVTISATGPGGTAGPILLTVNVYDPINADFSWLQGGPGPFDVQFTDTSTGAPAVAWSWTFGSPTLGTSAQRHPAFTFPGAASYQVRLVVTDGMGRQNIGLIDHRPPPGPEVSCPVTTLHSPPSFASSPFSSGSWACQPAALAS